MALSVSIVLLLFCSISFSIVTFCSSHFANPLSLIHVQECSVSLQSTVQISVNPTILSGLAGWVNVTYSNPNPAVDDWIALYSPSTVNFTYSAPAEYVWASSDPKYLTSGKGIHQFYVLNMRADVVFAFMQNGLDSPSVAALSSPVVFEHPSAPMHPRLALTSSPQQLIITWTQASAAIPQVLWGTAPNYYEYAAPGKLSTYSRSDMCGAPASTIGWLEPGNFYSAVMTSLVPGKVYYYRFGDATGFYSDEYTFVGPLVNPGNPWTAFLFGDIGAATIDGSTEGDDKGMPASLNTTKGILDDLNELRQQDPAHQFIVMHNGDISYASGYMSHWEVFQNLITPIAATVPWMTGEGNHERDFPNSGDIFGGTDSGGECGIAYQTRFPMPRPALLKDWYSIDFQNVHFLVFDSELNFTTGSEQYQFIQNDLAAVNRQTTPFVIAMTHRPQYVDSTNNDPPAGDQPVATLLRQYIEPLFKQYRVDLGWYGHHHSYLRTCPVYAEKCVSAGEWGTVHVISGAAGCPFSTNLEPKVPDWVMTVNNVDHGYIRATVFIERIDFEFVVGADRQLRDTFTIYKQSF